MLKKIKGKLSKIKTSLIKKEHEISLISIVILPLILISIVESIGRGGLIEFIRWIFSYPLNFTIYFFFFLLINIIFLMAFNRIYISTIIIAVPVVATAIISYNKMMIRELPLLPWNMALLKELAISISLVNSLIWIFAGSVVIIIIAIVVSSYFFIGIKTKFQIKTRLVIILTSVCICIPVLISFAGPIVGQNTLEIYKEKGLVPALIYYGVTPYMKKPKEYSNIEIQKLLNNIVVEKQTKGSSSYPDIIMVMGEAFWDPTELPNVDFIKDPVPNLHELSNTSVSGKLLVNSFGGNTTSTEFEALSGMCMSFIAPDCPVYTDFYHGQFPALPYFLNRLGYDTEAIHPYYSDFLNRKQAYPSMGFQKSYFLDSFERAEKIGNYVSDFSTGKKIIELYNQHKKYNSKNPYFSFTVTIQNHYDFDPGQYESSKEEIKTPNTLSKKEVKMLKGYVKGVHDTDALLGRLTSYFKKEKRPVVIIFFGDHLPALGEDFKFFEKAGFIASSNKNDITIEERRKLHTVPFIIWDNYQNKHKAVGCISAAYLQTVFLNEYKLPKNKFQQFLSQAMLDTKDYGLSAFPETQSKNETENGKKYRLLQYNLLFGKGYAKGICINDK